MPRTGADKIILFEPARCVTGRD